MPIDRSLGRSVSSQLPYGDRTPSRRAARSAISESARRPWTERVADGRWLLVFGLAAAIHCIVDRRSDLRRFPLVLSTTDNLCLDRPRTRA
jgi:hypothetical protein